MSATNNAEGRILNWLTGNATTAPTLPLRCRLMTANGSDSAAGTEVAGGTYAAQDFAADAVSGDGEATGAVNNDVIRFEGLPNPTTVVGFELWDSAGTPFRWHWAALTAPVTVTDGVFEFAAGACRITCA